MAIGFIESANNCRTFGKHDSHQPRTSFAVQQKLTKKTDNKQRNPNISPESVNLTRQTLLSWSSRYVLKILNADIVFSSVKVLLRCLVDLACFSISRVPMIQPYRWVSALCCTYTTPTHPVDWSEFRPFKWAHKLSECWSALQSTVYGANLVWFFAAKASSLAKALFSKAVNRHWNFFVFIPQTKSLNY